MRKHFTDIIPLLLINSVVLVGCATKETILPQAGPTMLEIYHGHFDRIGHRDREPGTEDSKGRTDNKNRDASATGNSDDEIGAHRPPHTLHPAQRERNARMGSDQYLQLIGYTRTVDNEIYNLFPTLHNPTLVMYVFPHLAGEENLPVPGYATAFPMYPKTEYALPGEVGVREYERYQNRLRQGLDTPNLQAINVRR